jgi:glycosyltransferase involved in cell wall biosynthesis
MNLAHVLPRRRRTNPAAPIRLMNVVPTLLCGGTETQFMALGRSLDPGRFELEFACLRRWGGFVDELESRGIPLVEYDIPSFWSFRAVAQQLRFARRVARRRIDIVHAYSFYGNMFAIPLARLAGAPLVIASIRDLAPYLTPMQRRAQRFACLFADRIVVNAEAVKRWLIGEGYDASKIVVIRNGVDLERFDRPARPEWVRHELGLPAGAPVVAVVSRLIRMKGLEQFLEAAAVVRMRFPSTRFLIVGDTNKDGRDYWSVLTGIVDRLGLNSHLVFAGLRTDVPALLSGVTVSVMPSLNEALSNVLLESLAAGVPVVATRVGGTPEAVEDGVNGLLVPPGDAVALADAICEALANPELAARLGCAARQTIVDRFSMDRMASATQALYESLLDAPRRAVAPGNTEFACK